MPAARWLAGARHVTHAEQFTAAVAACAVAAERLARERSDAAFEAWHRAIYAVKALWLARPGVR